MDVRNRRGVVGWCKHILRDTCGCVRLSNYQCGKEVPSPPGCGLFVLGSLRGKLRGVQEGSWIKPWPKDDMAFPRGLGPKGVQRGVKKLSTVATGKDNSPLACMVEGSRETCCL
jgi:hypothetical protein